MVEVFVKIKNQLAGFIQEMIQLGNDNDLNSQQKRLKLQLRPKQNISISHTKLFASVARLRRARIHLQTATVAWFAKNLPQAQA